MVCESCRLGRLHPLPDAETIRAFYPDEYYGSTGNKFQPMVEAGVRLVAARHARFLARGLQKGARILDVGCGRGVLLGAFADRGCEVHGVEMSETAVEGVDPRVHIRIADRLQDVGYSSHYFDEVILWHVLEHLPEPRAIFEEIHRILRPRGRFVVAVPNFSSWQARWAGAGWFHLDPPRHLFHFSLPALRTMLAHYRFQVESEHHFSLRQNPFGWVQSALNRFQSLPRTGLYTLLHQRDRSQPKPFNARTRIVLRLAFVLGMPAAVVISILAAAFRSGATIHIVARSESE